MFYRATKIQTLLSTIFPKIFTFSYYRLLLFLFIVLLTAASPTVVQAQSLTADTSQNLEPTLPGDSLGRRTPRGTVTGFIDAVAAENYTKAANYLNLTPELLKNTDGANLAQALQRLLDQRGNIFPYSRISDNPNGQTEDNLPPNLERIGTATADGETIDLLLEKTADASGAPVWLFSSGTMQQVPALVEESTGPLINKLLPDFLEVNKWAGVPVGHWLAILILAVLAYLLAWLITRAATFILRLFWKKSREEPNAGIVKAFALPIRLYLSVFIFIFYSQSIGISIIVRQRFSDVTIIVGLVAFLLLLWRLIDVLTSFGERRMARRGNSAGISAVLFFKRGAKFALIMLGIIAALDTFGVDVTTGLAALGIGGIALALGAQKTVENFVGSVTLIADQPIRVGDFCKVGDTTGTVEQIGMRSTRIRTLDRTVVTIPNGEFSSLKIENYAHRDMFRLQPVLGLRYETTPDQIRYLLVEIRSVLYAHPKIDPEPARVRFLSLGSHSINIEIFAYVKAKDYSEFLEIQEDLLLRIMDIIAKSGTGLAFPSQTIYVAQDKGLSEEKTLETEELVRKWREKGEMHIPSFDPEHIKNLKNTIPYPPIGSSMHSSEK